MIKLIVRVCCFMFFSSHVFSESLEGKVAIVTGASKVIGKSIAQVFSKKGVKVILVSRTEADLKSVVEDIIPRW